MSIDVYILIFIYDDYVKSWCYIDHIFLGNFKRILWSSSSWESWILLFNNAMPAQHFFLSLKQKINLSSLPPIAMTKAHDFMEFATIYIEISSHDLIIYSTASLNSHDKSAWFHGIRYHLYWNFFPRFDYLLYRKSHWNWFHVSNSRTFISSIS